MNFNEMDLSAYFNLFQDPVNESSGKENFVDAFKEIIDDPSIMSDDGASICGSPELDVNYQKVNDNWQNEEYTYAVLDKCSGKNNEMQPMVTSSSEDFDWEHNYHYSNQNAPYYEGDSLNVFHKEPISFDENKFNLKSEDFEGIDVLPINLPLNRKSDFEKKLEKFPNCSEPNTFILPREIPKNDVSEFLRAIKSRTSQKSTDNLNNSDMYSSSQHRISAICQKETSMKVKKARSQQKQNKYKHRKTRDKPNNCYHLWTFLEELLDGKLYQEHTCVEWTDRQNLEFRIINTKLLATLWGQKKGSENMTYDKLSRTFRYYCTYDILKKINGKRLQFKFGQKRMWSKDSI